MYSCLENPRGQKVWRATVHGVAKSCTKWATKRTHRALDPGACRAATCPDRTECTSLPWSQGRDGAGALLHHCSSVGGVRRGEKRVCFFFFFLDFRGFASNSLNFSFYLIYPSLLSTCLSRSTQTEWSKSMLLFLLPICQDLSTRIIQKISRTMMLDSSGLDFWHLYQASDKDLNSAQCFFSRVLDMITFCTN